MHATTRTQRRYDHRLRELVCNAQNVDVAVRHGVPHSTARGWLAPMTTPVVTLNVANQDVTRLQQEVIALRPADNHYILDFSVRVLTTSSPHCRQRHAPKELP